VKTKPYFLEDKEAFHWLFPSNQTWTNHSPTVPLLLNHHSVWSHHHSKIQESWFQPWL